MSRLWSSLFSETNSTKLASKCIFRGTPSKQTFKRSEKKDPNATQTNGPSVQVAFSLAYKRMRKRGADHAVAVNAIYSAIVDSLNRLQHDNAIEGSLWSLLIRRIETIWGPWGKMSSTHTYHTPSIVTLFMQASMILYYLIIVPYFITKGGDMGIVTSFFIILLFSGGYSTSSKIQNPYRSSSGLNFFKKPETVGPIAKEAFKLHRYCHFFGVRQHSFRF